MINRKIICILCLVALSVAAYAAVGFADEKPFRLGIIGLDTSHVSHFTNYMNDPANNTGCKVVAAYRGGSADIPVSADRLDMFTKELKDKYGVEIVGSIEELCKKVDGILLESVDGRPHLEQARPVFAAGKPMFIDKPLAGNLADAVEIFKLSKASGVPCWTSSTWRFTDGVEAVKQGKVGDVIGCIAYGPCSTEPHHPDLYWYGIHTAETLFALMGPGCEIVTRATSVPADVVVGQWKDGRIGIFRGQRHAGGEEGFLVFGSKGVYNSRHIGGYPVLLKEIVKFFKTGKPPVTPEETLNLFAFMSAADESKAKGGAPVGVDEVLKKAQAEVDARSGVKKAATEKTRDKDKLRIVFFGAHCDDSEVAVGGLMAKLAAQGHEVISAYGTTHRGERKFFGRPEDEVRRAESSEACKILGAKPYFFPYPHEGLFADEKTISTFRKWLEEVNPDIVVTQWPIDTHPNHQVVSFLVLQCYNHGGRIWGQERTSVVKNREKAQKSWNLYFYEACSFANPADVESLAFTPNLYVDIEDVLEQKKEAVDCFKSQAEYNLWEDQELGHTARGKECGVKRAETLFLVEAKSGCPLLPIEFLQKKEK